MKANPSLLLSLLIPVFLALGVIAPFAVPSTVVVVGVGVATFLTVAGLSQGWHSRMSNYTSAGRLFIVNLLAGSVPLVLIALLLGASSPTGLGFMILAFMPVAAGLPAYAATLGVSAERITLFTLMSYAVALVVTPIAVSILLGDSSTRPAITATIIFALVLPTIVGIVLTKPVTRIPMRIRRRVTIAALLTAIFGVGTQIGVGFSTTSMVQITATVIVLALLRAPVTALLGIVLNSAPALRTDIREAALSGGYRNCALAAVIALAAGIPEAAIPGAIGLASEALLLLGLTMSARQLERSTHRTSRREDT